MAKTYHFSRELHVSFVYHSAILNNTGMIVQLPFSVKTHPGNMQLLTFGRLCPYLSGLFPWQRNCPNTSGVTIKNMVKKSRAHKQVIYSHNKTVCISYGITICVNISIYLHHHIEHPFILPFFAFKPLPSVVSALHRWHSGLGEMVAGYLSIFIKRPLVTTDRRINLPIKPHHFMYWSFIRSYDISVPPVV